MGLFKKKNNNDNNNESINQSPIQTSPLKTVIIDIKKVQSDSSNNLEKNETEN